MDIFAQKYAFTKQIDFIKNAYMAFLQIPQIKAAMAERSGYLIVNDYHLAFW